MVTQALELIELDVVDSTNTWALNRVREQGASQSFVVLAHEQTQGRGRAGRAWASTSQGSVCMSVVQVFQGPVRPCASIIAGVEVARVLRGLGVAGVQLKWPNDVLLHGRKLGGLLCELLTVGQYTALVVGLGLNLRGVDQPEALGGAGSANLLQDGGALISLSKAELCMAFAQGVVQGMEAERQQGFEAWRLAFNEMDAWMGREVQVLEQGAPTLSGRACGCAQDGAYVLHTPEGFKSVHVGDVSLRPLP